VETLNDEHVDAVFDRIRLLKYWLGKADNLTDTLYDDERNVKGLLNRIEDVQLEAEALAKEIKAGKVEPTKRTWFR
jgi:hypothetical protein